MVEEELSVSEQRLIESVSAVSQSNIDVKEVRRLVKSNAPFGNLDFLSSSVPLKKMPVEEQAAAEVLIARYYQVLPLNKKGAEAILGLETQINAGMELLEYYGGACLEA